MFPSILLTLWTACASCLKIRSLSALLTQQHLAGLFNEVPPSLPILNLGDTAPWGDSPTPIQPGKISALLHRA